jgi:SAM-dependent methyltransferase
MTRILDVGCGRKRRPGSIGIDHNPDSAADILHDLNEFPYPLADDSFDEVWCDSILEHLSDTVGVMRELHRIGRPGARVTIITPYFTSLDAYTDPTHVHYFSARSFDYFTGEFQEFRYYAEALRFRKRRVEIVFWPLPRMGNVYPQHLLGAHILANRFTSVYERFFAYLLPAQTIIFELEVMK